MPVFVEWKWIEKTKSLLTIFHFYDDFSKANLRLVKIDDDIWTSLYSPKMGFESTPPLKKSWISWSPSHLEMALLMQVLCYANIINGLKPSEKKKLWFELEGKEEMHPEWGGGATEEELPKIAVPGVISERIGKDKKVVTYSDLRQDTYEREIYTCVELCPEYIDYLRELLEPYIKD